jgi:hypothetical protein
MRIPSNIITTGKYTIGKEFINTSDNKLYQGFYYQIGDRSFVGKSFDQNAPELKKVTDDHFFFTDKNKEYGRLTQLDPKSIQEPKSIYNPDMSIKDAGGDYFYTYYAKKYNYYPILIREINKETYDNLKNNNIWQVIALVTTQGDGGVDIKEINRAEKEMPGIKTWLMSLGIGYL